MENKLKGTLGSLSVILSDLVLNYYHSKDLFIKNYNKLPSSVKVDITTLYKTHNLVDTEYEELPDISGEVLFYVDMYNQTDSKAQPAEAFTLRNKEDLKTFEEFLSKMVKLLGLSPYYFIKLFPQCPQALWDKVDDLRERSFKKGKESDRHTRCLEDSRKISFGFAELSGVCTNKYD